MKNILLAILCCCSLALYAQDSATEKHEEAEGLMVSGGINYAGFAVTNGNLYILTVSSDDVKIQDHKIKNGTIISFSVRSTNNLSAQILVTNGKSSTTPSSIFAKENERLAAGTLDAGRLILAIFHENGFYLIEGKEELAKYLTLCENTWTNLDRDKNYCGACDIKCALEETCIDGRCVKKCSGTKSRCGTECLNLSTDLNNCGQCNITCPPGEICHEGQCRSTCPIGKILCNDQCIDLQSDAGNCSACGIACMPGFVCYKGKCIIQCPENRIKCNETCVDLLKDKDNCGACGLECPDGYSCQDGVCLKQCEKGQRLCDGDCIDVFSDANHCGNCNKICPPGQTCRLGKCQ